MGIEIKCFATLAGLEPDNGADYPVSEGETVGTLLVKIGIPAEEVAIIFINSVRSFIESPVKDGDRVGLFPAVGGG